jgi:hypothetical protein
MGCNFPLSIRNIITSSIVIIIIIIIIINIIIIIHGSSGSHPADAVREAACLPHLFSFSLQIFLRIALSLLCTPLLTAL